MISVSRLLCDEIGPGDHLRYGRNGTLAPAAEARPIVVWNCTRRCNLRCIHCYADATAASCAPEMTTAEGEAFIAQLADFGVPVLLFSGGEPLVREDFFDLAAYASGKGLGLVVSTNGTLITPDVAREIRRLGFREVGISLDGIAAKNDYFRGTEGAFEAALRGIRNCVAAGQRVSLRMTVTRANQGEISALFDLAEREGIDRLCFYHLAYAGRGNDLRSVDLNHSETRSVVDLICDRTLDLYRRGLRKEVLLVANHADGVYLYLKAKAHDEERAAKVLELHRINGGNNSGIRIGAVDEVGNVHPDQFWRTLTLGNVLKRPFGEIWLDISNPVTAGLKDRKGLLKGRCAACRYLDLCNGNLRSRAEAVFDDMWAEDPACYLTDEEIGIHPSLRAKRSNLDFRCHSEPKAKNLIDSEGRDSSVAPLPQNDISPMSSRQSDEGIKTVIAHNNHLTPHLQLVAWEITKRCNLSCVHCRASAEDAAYEGELSTGECFGVIDSIAEVGRPILILTGGEPLLRTDVFEIGKHAAARGLRVVLGTNGTVITPDVAEAMKSVPVSRIGVSLDFPTAELQDRFRGKSGAFEAAIAGIKEAKKAGIGVQINSTITKMNAPYLDDLLNLALELGAVAFHPFMLVPTGRGKGLAESELAPEEYERILNWVYDKQRELGDRIFFKPTDAPHYQRIVMQRGGHSARPKGHPGAMNTITRGCLAGIGFAFISHVGRVQGCGYLDVEAGNVRKESFAGIWSTSPLFRDLRDLSNLKGKCGACEYKRACGGCRARAYERTGDYLESEPYCIYKPRGRSMSGETPDPRKDIARRAGILPADHRAETKAGLDGTDRTLVNLLQSGFPLVPQPYAEIASKLVLTEAEVLERLSRLREERIIRILGPVFNSRALGYRSTLVAMRVPSERVEEATGIINAHPGVGHDYLRDHHYNLWFTLAVRSDKDLEETLQSFQDQIRPEAMLELPALRLFKIRLFFDLEGNGGEHDESHVETLHATSLHMSPLERAIINEVQQQLPAVSRPFDRMARKVGMTTDEFLACCRSLLERGIMRRFGASIEHRNAGFVANAMVCWAVPPSSVEDVGFKMAVFKEVTHCYERKTSPLWPRYNIFSMIHGKTSEENSVTVARMVETTGIRNYEALPTLREFKKERVKYRV